MEVKEILAVNLRTLRKAASLTQMELAEKLNYSDKSVSKWEHGDATPDIEVLSRIAEFYGVTVDYLISPHDDGEGEELPQEYNDKRVKTNRFIITALAALAPWLAATVVYVMLLIWLDVNYWLAFVWAVPASAVVLIVFNAIWGKYELTFVFISVLLWSVITCIFLQTLKFMAWQLYIIGVPLQAAVVLWALLRKKRKK